MGRSSGSAEKLIRRLGGYDQHISHVTLTPPRREEERTGTSLLFRAGCVKHSERRPFDRRRHPPRRKGELPPVRARSWSLTALGPRESEMHSTRRCFSWLS